MTKTYEIAGKFETEGNAQSLLYAPPPRPLTFRKTMRYVFEFEGSEAALDAFVSRVLVDAISQEEHHDGAPLWPHAAFILDYGMKGGALDLEKEAVLSYYRTIKEPGFDLGRLTIRTRIYVVGDGADPAPFVRDMVNPAIHTHEVVGKGRVKRDE